CRSAVAVPSSRPDRGIWRRLCTPAGVPAISRGLSAAIPPVPESRMELHPEWVPASVAVEISADSRRRIGDLYDVCLPCGCDPSGVEFPLRATQPGASLRSAPG